MSKDVATRMPRPMAWYRTVPENEAEVGHLIYGYLISPAEAAAIAAPSPDAILIDPTDPETVAALAAAQRWWAENGWRDHSDAELWPPDGHGDEDYAVTAAAILPAFVARLRGET